jgi:hypothetical protein
MFTFTSLSHNKWHSVTYIMQNGVNSQNATVYLFSTLLSTCPNTFVTHVQSTGQLLLCFINRSITVFIQMPDDSNLGKPPKYHSSAKGQCIYPNLRWPPKIKFLLKNSTVNPPYLPSCFEILFCYCDMQILIPISLSASNPCYCNSASDKISYTGLVRNFSPIISPI